MNNLPAEDIQKLLGDLSLSYFAGKRLAAVRKLGELTATNAEIVRALAAAAANDDDPVVRSTAELALQAPVHREFLEDNPWERIRQRAEQIKAEEQAEQEAKYIREFTRRLKIQRRLMEFMLLAVFMLSGTMIGMVTLDINFVTIEWYLRVMQVFIFAFAGYSIWRSWRVWRCPACDSYLVSLGSRGINVFSTYSPLHCPHCHTRLL